jgi:hypothetical protein
VPNLELHRKQAKALVRAHRAGCIDALARRVAECSLAVYEELIELRDG